VSDTIDVAAAAAPWDYSDLANPPDLWLDDQSSISGGGSNVTQWSDRSGNARHYTEHTFPPQAASAVLNGYRVIRFNGSNQHLNGNSAAQNIIDNTAVLWSFFVYKTNTTDGSGTDRALQTYQDSAGTSTMYLVAAGRSAGKNKPNIAGRRVPADSASSLLASAEYPQVWTMLLVSEDFQNRTLDMWINGEHDGQLTGAFGSSGNSGGGVSAYARIGAGGGSGAAIHLNGDIALVISGRDTLPDSDEIDKIFGKAAHYYGLTGLLDGSHPYKTNPPTV